MLRLENKLYRALIDLSLFFGISSGIAGIVAFVNTNKLTPVLLIYLSILILFVFPKLIYAFKSLKFRKITEKEFINRLDFKKINKVIVLSHTGRVIFNEIYNKLDNMDVEDIPKEIRVLTRTKLIESMDRNEYIRGTITKVNDLRERLKIHYKDSKNVAVDVRFYEAIPSIRGIICEDRNNKRITFSSAYYWKKPNKSSSFGYSFIIRDKNVRKKKQVELLESWIDQFWGKDEIHTIIFDFDDTIVPSMDLQIKAWIQTIEEIIVNDIYKNKLIPDLKKLINGQNKIIDSEKFYTIIKNVFILHQLAEVIIDNLFIGLSDGEVKDINKLRFEKREGLLSTVLPFDGLRDRLEELHSDHNFAIITSTDERMVRNYLNDIDLLKYFSAVLGKNDPSLRYERDNIYKKSYLIMKLSEIIGIPISRMIYIGDNNSDFLATRQVGIDFIEARMAAKKISKNSLIEIDDFKKKKPIGYFEDYLSNKLNEIIIKRSKEKKIKKFKLDDFV